MKQREYETIFIVRPDVGEEEHNKALERVRGAIESKGGTLLNEENWGKRKLAYEVKKHLKGYYHYFQFAGPNDVVAHTEWTIKMTDAIIKFQTVKLNEDIDIDERRVEIEKAREEAEAKAKADAEARSSRSDDDDEKDETDDESAEDNESDDASDEDEEKDE